MKRKIFTLFLCAAAAVGCRGPMALNEEEAVDDELGDQRKMDNFLAPIGGGTGDTLYITGVEYPEGYDWSGDIGTGAEGARLFLMKEGETVTQVAVGYSNCVSADADMHRCIGGHLYTDFSTDDETVVGMDGQELFRYSGREMIRSMYVEEDLVFTLGVPRSGGGWTFRRNGQTILSRDAGELVGGLYKDGNSIVFSFREAGTDKCYVVNNGLAAAVSTGENFSYVDDLRLVNGEVNCVGSLSGSSGKWLVSGEECSMLEWTDSYDVNDDLSLWYGGKDFFISGSLGQGYALWRGSSLEARIDGGIVGMAVSGDTYIYIRGTARDGPEAICTESGSKDWPEGYDFIYGNCVATNGKKCAVGMVKRSEDNRPALWIDGTRTDLDFNGVITGLWYQ